MKILLGADLYVLRLVQDALKVRFGNQGMFHTQELFLHEVELVVVNEDEYS